MPSDFFIRSPPMRVVWAGWESTSVRLQRCGWEFAVQYSPWEMRTAVMLHHRETGWAGEGVIDDDHLRGAALRSSNMAMFSGANTGEMPILQLRRMTCDRYMPVAEPLTWQRVNMMPEYGPVDTIEISKMLNETGIFRPWAPDAQELVIDPNSVADLMSRIRTLQAPELQAIRERNRARDLREQRQENVVAQVITLAT